MQTEMNIFARSVRNSIWRVLLRRESKTVKIGPHSVKLNQQAYRGKNNPVHFSKLLSRILFGVDNSKMGDYRIYRTGNVCLVTIPSAERAKNIFTIADDCAMELYIENNINNNNNNNNNNIVRYCAAGKVRIQDIVTGVGIVGYVLSVNERTHELTVHLEDDEEVIIPPPTYDSNTLRWIFPTFNYDGTTHEVDTYEPIRILISKLGYMSYIMHRFDCTVNTTTHRIRTKFNQCS